MSIMVQNMSEEGLPGAGAPGRTGAGRTGRTHLPHRLQSESKIGPGINF